LVALFPALIFDVINAAMLPMSAIAPVTMAVIASGDMVTSPI